MSNPEMYNSKYGSIDKLSSTNYDTGTWKPRISAILSAMLALKIVTGEETGNALPAGNSAANVAKQESFGSGKLLPPPSSYYPAPTATIHKKCRFKDSNPLIEELSLTAPDIASDPIDPILLQQTQT
ncbi:hypothetical protein BZA05DRAFT_417459 [Tricharina praecox]|uniref:uncharacterized protein n=1 Tax=Tricharina praecox TaxID=43433 RepID=UPI00221FD5EF|nr:uncharacterized protein BZA05DRAFT_417459 [Tricharina praecox]KAI5854992.1 hypothetical protein BZA05DRAFT_417459 [Tricharina praecox]